MQSQLSIYQYAIAYAEQGFAVFPCHSITDAGACTCGKPDCGSPGKHPMTSHGVKDATRDEAQISAWFDVPNPPNIAIATGPVSGGLYVVDIDQGKGGDAKDLYVDGVDALAFTTPKVKTGSGLHYYYRDSAGMKNSSNRLGKAIDTRGEGGYVIAPPSKHISGNHYEFANDITQPLDLPSAWAAILNAPKSTNGSQKNGSAAGSSPFIVPPPGEPQFVVPDIVDPGSRNNTLTQIAGTLRRAGLVEADIFVALRSVNTRVCQPPLTDDEVQNIARSVGRYRTDKPIATATDNDADDYENTLRPYIYSQFREMEFEEKEILAFHIGKRDIAIIQAATNAGKTTLLRNVALCMAAGRPFMPFYDGARPIKIAYFDFENDAQDVQRDLKIMDDSLTAAEIENVKKNLIVIPKGLMGGELFQFNTNEKWANELIRENNVEFVVVDNVSAAYDLNDENSNAEVTKKVIKPLLKMAYRGDCCFLFAHHYGKLKANEVEQAGVHAGRGASALQALSRTVINMKGDVSKGEPVTVECAKRKTDGGQNYSEVFTLEADRWFHHTTIAPAPPKQTAYQAVRRYMQAVQYPDKKTTAQVIDEFENQFTPDSIKKALSELYKDGYIDRPKHGEYCGKSNQKTASNYYEKDED